MKKCDRSLLAELLKERILYMLEDPEINFPFIHGLAPGPVLYRNVGGS